jgi:Flp pilus assembly protein protease CpaA
MFDLILALIVVLVLLISSLIDIKTREVPDKLSIGLIVVAVLFKLLQAFFAKDWNIIFSSFIGFAVFLGISLIMYYTRQWGGGDAKLFMAIGIALPYFPKDITFLNPHLSMNFLLIILVNVLIFGFIYGMSYIFYLYFKRKIKIDFKLNKSYLLVSILSIVLSMFFRYELKILLLLLALIILIYPYLITLTKEVEKKILTYKIKVSKLTEGDWIIDDIKYKNKLVYSKKSPGITNKQIGLLKKYKIKEVLIKEGIPFVPAIFLGVLFSLIFGSILF